MTYQKQKVEKDQQDRRNLNGDVPTSEDINLANDLRKQAFHLMENHPASAVHLVLAAAGIAPASDDELNVAIQLEGMLQGITAYFQGLHDAALELDLIEKHHVPTAH